MIHYILQTIAFQLLFLVVYDLFLKKETFFTWNRIYLLATPIISFLLPLFKIEAFRNAIPEQYLIQLPAVIVGGETAQKSIQLDAVTISETSTSLLTISEIVQIIWVLGMLVALTLFSVKVIKFYKLKQLGTLSKFENLKIIQLPNSKAAFSFFNTIFLGSDLSEKQKENILLHEKVHAKQKHTADLLFFEALRIICWFNPLVYVFQKKITELQEFIADSSVAKQQPRKTYYQNLLSQVFQTSDISFTNTFFNQSLIKKRIVMLQKSKSKKIFQLKYLLLIPVVCSMLFYTSCSEETPVSEEPASLTQKIANLQAEIENRDSFTEEEKKSIIDMNYKVMKKVTKGEPSVSITKYETDVNNLDMPFAAIDKVPTFPGCEGMNNKEAKECMSKKVQQFAAENFNTKVADQANLTGKQRIFVQFKIDKQGNITDARARAPHPDLEAEALRVVNKIPKMQPGEHRGKEVGVLYSLPILFIVE
ncbi:MAG: blaR1 peptidase M56 [Flavobacteriaceae bacterium]|nr:blaR1 peptidase M56 [Flavobacteriaceae bacterium]